MSLSAIIVRYNLKSIMTKTSPAIEEEPVEKDNKLKMMRFWIFGTFIIIMTGVTIYIGSVVGTSTAIFGEMRFWIAIFVSAILCVLGYFAYDKYLDRKE